MRVFGCLVVQNEADIIVELLNHFRQLRLFEGLFFYDLGSEDETFSRALQFEDILDSAEIVREPYTMALRESLLLTHSRVFQPGDWLTVIDADEFYAEDPRRLLSLAEAEGADSLTTYQMQYGFTDRDLEAFDDEDTSLPIGSRRRYYLIDWSEARFYRYLPDQDSFACARPCSRRLLNRHYQYRSPEQIRQRLRTRLENRQRAADLPGRSSWTHVFSSDWRDFVRPHRLYHFDDGGPPKFGLPSGATIEDYRRPGDPFAEELPRIALAFAKEQASVSS